MTSWTRSVRRASALLVAVATVLALIPAAASARPGRSGAIVSWSGATPAEGALRRVTVGKKVKISLAASAPGGPAVPIQIRTSGAVPAGASLHATDGNPAQATFAWTPTTAGDVRVTFTATTAVPVDSAQPRTVAIRVSPAWPQRSVLSDPATHTYKWAFVRHRTFARTGPSRGARGIGPVSTRTPEYFKNLLQVLSSVQLKKGGEMWVRVRLASLPNSRIGWVPRRALAHYRTVRTKLIVDRRHLRATLYRRGVPVFKTVVGVGQSQWPTPRGEFYVREILTGYNVPAYGPVAFGLSARSTVLTDWVGGGFVGIHGTNQPGILPGRVSHGCIRMRNGPILRLHRLMPLGTPVIVR